MKKTPGGILLPKLVKNTPDLCDRCGKLFRDSETKVRTKIGLLYCVKCHDYLITMKDGEKKETIKRKRKRKKKR